MPRRTSGVLHEKDVASRAEAYAAMQDLRRAARVRCRPTVSTASQSDVSISALPDELRRVSVELLRLLRKHYRDSASAPTTLSIAAQRSASFNGPQGLGRSGLFNSFRGDGPSGSVRPSSLAVDAAADAALAEARLQHALAFAFSDISDRYSLPEFRVLTAKSLTAEQQQARGATDVGVNTDGRGDEESFDFGQANSVNASSGAPPPVAAARRVSRRDESLAGALTLAESRAEKAERENDTLTAELASARNQLEALTNALAGNKDLTELGHTADLALHKAQSANLHLMLCAEVEKERERASSLLQRCATASSSVVDELTKQRDELRRSHSRTEAMMLRLQATFAEREQGWREHGNALEAQLAAYAHDKVRVAKEHAQEMDRLRQEVAAARQSAIRAGSEARSRSLRGAPKAEAAQAAASGAPSWRQYDQGHGAGRAPTPATHIPSRPATSAANAIPHAPGTPVPKRAQSQASSPRHRSALQLRAAVHADPRWFVT